MAHNWRKAPWKLRSVCVELTLAPRLRDIIPQKPDVNESEEQPQRISSVEPPLSPWSSIADSDEFWQFDNNKMFNSIGPEALNDGSELGDSTANHTYGEADLPEFSNWDCVNKEMERGDLDIIPGYRALSPDLMDSRTSQGEVLTDALPMSLGSPTKSVPYQQATQRPRQTSEKIGARLTPLNLIDLGRPTHDLSVPLPRVVISDAALDSVGEGKKCAVPELYANTSSTKISFHAQQTLGQKLQESEASSDRGSQVRDSSQDPPNNYEIAMHDRYPSYTVTSLDGPQFGTPVAERLNAFYADADSITANVAADFNTKETLGVKRRRVSSNLSTLQIPIKTPSGSQSWQVSSGSAASHSNFRNTLQGPPYPTPTSYFGGSNIDHQLDIAFTTDNSPSDPTTPSCASTFELSSPVSPSPSNLSDAVDGVTRCPSCPEKAFTGTPRDQKNSLQRHMRDIHKGMPRLECLVPECTASFGAGRKDNRIKHVRAMHPDFPLPASSTKRKRKADSDLESY